MRCETCGSTLRRFEYQSRSADEAHTVIDKCPSCPIDVSRLYNEIKTPHTFLSTRTKKPVSTKRSSVTRTREAFIVRVTSRSPIESSSKVVECKSSLILNQESKMFRVFSSGVWKGLSIHKASQKRISLNVVVERVIVGEAEECGHSESIDFCYYELGDSIVICSGERPVFCSLMFDATDEKIMDVVRLAYIEGFCPSSLLHYVSTVTLSSMSNLNARAYDASSAPDKENFFTSKPDGERMWLVKSGCVWFYCRRLKGYSIESFHMSDRVSEVSSKGVSHVVDTEVMLGYKDILIDILMFNDGEISPSNRTVPWILDTMTEMRKTEKFLNEIYVRPFFDNLREAQIYTSSVRYPVDGIVAISASGTDMKKIKDIKSMELRVTSDYCLETEDNTKLIMLRNIKEFDEGEIVEVRFKIESGRFLPQDIFTRPDKSSANQMKAVDSILSSLVQSTPDSMIRNIMWRWSNDLRFSIYRRVNQYYESRSIVLDIGTGGGQSCEAYSRTTGCSFILVEPDQEKCISLCRKLEVKGYDKSPRSFINVLSQLRKRTKKYHILNCSLQDILNDQACTKALKNIIKCAVACFSAHYVIDLVDDLSELGIPLVGCYYSYEGVEVGSCIISSGDIEMRRTSQTTATVKWGRDREYEEPVVDENDMPMTVSKIDALDVVPLGHSDPLPQVVKACKAVKVLISQ